MIILVMSLVLLVGIDQLQVILNKKVGVSLTADSSGIDTDLTLDSASSALSAGGSLLNNMNLNYLYQQFIKYLFVVLIPVFTNFINFVITFAIEKLT